MARLLTGLLGVGLAVGGCGGDPPAAKLRAEPAGVAALPAGVLPWVGRVAIDWTRTQAPGERIRIGRAGFVAGPAEGSAEGPSRHYLLSSAERREDLRFFVGTFAPFTWSEGGEVLSFRGEGTAVAAAAERRMVGEWVRWMVSERELAAGSLGGGAGSAYGLVLSWHRSREGGGCDQLKVDRIGVAHAGACNGPEELRGRLGDEALRQLYVGFDAWAPFQATSEGGGLLASRLLFAGQGKTLAPAAEQAALVDFANALFRQLAARRPRTPQTPAGSPAVPEPAGPGLLRPQTPLRGANGSTWRLDSF